MGYGLAMTGIISLSADAPTPPEGELYVIDTPTIPLVENPSFEVGDIVVKPNNNWLPGTSGVITPLDFEFGHAVLVIGDSPSVPTGRLSVLSQTPIFEAQSRNVPRPCQVRANWLWHPSTDSCELNDSFGEAFRGYRFRLRLPLTMTQKKALVDFMKAQDNRYFSWRSLKQAPLTSADNRSWYCALLIWHGFYKVLGIDLDANQGWYVYPNDLINSPYFNNISSDHSRIIRF